MLEQKLSAAQLENQAIAKKAELDLREAKVEVAEEQLRLKEQVSLEKIQTRDQIVQERLSNKQQVTTMIESKSKEAQANASRADAKIGQGMNSLKQTAQAVEQARAEMLAAIQQQGAQTQAMVMEILNAIRAPRVRVPVRGKDGRILQVIDRPQDEAEGTVQ